MAEPGDFRMCDVALRRESTPSRIPAITLWQPWASLVAAGAKPFEFRSWPAPTRLVGQRIAVHAGARPVKKDELRELLLRLHSSFWRETGLVREPAIKLLESALMAPTTLWRSAIMCTATLGASMRDAELAAKLGLPNIADSDRYEHTNWGWPLDQVERLEPPLPARGAQGWWMWTPPNA